LYTDTGTGTDRRSELAGQGLVANQLRVFYNRETTIPDATAATAENSVWLYINTASCHLGIESHLLRSACVGSAVLPAIPGSSGVSCASTIPDGDGAISKSKMRRGIPAPCSNRLRSGTTLDLKRGRTAPLSPHCLLLPDALQPHGLGKVKKCLQLL
jgi:hypothetical protein